MMRSRPSTPLFSWILPVFAFVLAPSAGLAWLTRGALPALAALAVGVGVLAYWQRTRARRRWYAFLEDFARREMEGPHGRGASRAVTVPLKE